MFSDVNPADERHWLRRRARRAAAARDAEPASGGEHDRVRSGAIAARSTNTTQAWSFSNRDTAQATAMLEAGATRALWAQLLPTAVQLWQFPLIHSPYTLQSMVCNSGAFEPKYVYPGQPNGAVYTQADSVGATGAVATGHTETLTAIGNNDILHYQDRNVPQSLLDALYAPLKPGTANGGSPRLRYLGRCRSTCTTKAGSPRPIFRRPRWTANWSAPQGSPTSSFSGAIS
jgi:hypothetical protein